MAFLVTSGCWACGLRLPVKEARLVDTVWFAADSCRKHPLPPGPPTPTVLPGKAGRRWQRHAPRRALSKLALTLAPAGKKGPMKHTAKPTGTVTTGLNTASCGGNARVPMEALHFRFSCQCAVKDGPTVWGPAPTWEAQHKLLAAARPSTGRGSLLGSDPANGGSHLSLL